MILGYSVIVDTTAKSSIEKTSLKNKMQSTLHTIAQSSKLFLVNYALDELENKIELDMKNQYIQAIVIRDIFFDEDIVISYRDKKGNIVFSKKLPTKYKAYEKIQTDIIDIKSYTKTKLGIVTLYYKNKKDNSLVDTFTIAQKEYLQTKKELKMCIDPNWFPFEKIEKGKHIGITSDYMQLFSQAIQIPIKLVPTKSWIESLEKIKNKQCDILSLANKTEQREKYIDFSLPYITTPIVLATKTEISFIDNISQIKEKKLGIVKGYSLKQILKKEYPNINIVDVESISDGLEKVEKGIIFGYLDNTIVINHQIQNNFLGTITISGKLKNIIDLSVGIRSDEVLLREIFDKVILSISTTKKDEILHKWVKINYEKHTDYTLVWQLLVIFIIIILITIYWNRKLSNLNTQLKIQRDKAKELSKIKSEFLANMSHEIRTPMNGIIGMSTLVLKNDLDNKSRDYIQKIEYSANSLLNIINDILDFSKMEAGKLSIEKIDFNLKDLINSIVTLQEHKIYEKGLDFSVEYKNINYDIFYGDSLRISQVITNLLSNAIKFTQKGKISLKVEEISQNRYQFKIKDTGIGLKKEDISKLFQSFTQADGTITRKYGGSGLGLSISKQLVELMNGKIWIDEKQKIGSCFIFYIELIGKSSDESTLLNKKDSTDYETIENKNLEDVSILLVEDNKINQDIVLGLLDHSSIDIASNGQEAVDIFTQNKDKYRLILMDMQMPIMSGIEATKIIRKEDSNIPIIALTANAMAEDIVATKSAGMNHHLIKPIDADKLYTTLFKYLKKDIDINNYDISNTNNNTFGLKYLDSNQALKKLNNNEKLYKKILNDFYKQYNNIDFEQMEKDEFQRALHTLKGLSLNIGAVKLHKIVKELENSSDKVLIEELKIELNKIVKELKNIIPKKNSSDIKKLPITEELKEKLFSNLIEALEHKRPKIILPAMEELDKYSLDLEDQKIFDKAKELILSYNYKDVLVLLLKR